MDFLLSPFAQVAACFKCTVCGLISAGRGLSVTATQQNIRKMYERESQKVKVHKTNENGQDKQIKKTFLINLETPAQLKGYISRL